MADAAENAKPDAASGTMHVRKENGIGWMIYDQQAKYNADLRHALRHSRIMADFEADDVQVAVIAGAGEKAFISGSDISSSAAVVGRGTQDVRRSPEQANLAMRNFPKPMIAMIHGYCRRGY